MNYTLKEHPSLIGFYQIPNFNNYWITISGEVYSDISKDFLKGSSNPAGYINFRLKTDLGVTLTVGVHRLLCLTFKPTEADVRFLVVNHINGIKIDNSLENLEWVTQQENCEHAGRLRLSPKCTPISVRDIDTKEILKFPSIISCANFFHVHKDFIRYRLRFGENRVFPERKQYRNFHSDKEWVISDIEKELNSYGRSQKVLLRYVQTGEVMRFDKLSHLSNFLHLSLSTITLWSTLPNQPILPGYIQIQKENNYLPWREPKEIMVEFGENNKRKVKIKNKLTHEEKNYNSIKECADDNGLKISTVHYRLRMSKNIFFNNISFEYSS